MMRDFIFYLKRVGILTCCLLTACTKTQANKDALKTKEPTHEETYARVESKSVDISTLNEDQMAVYQKAINQALCPCECPLTLAGCLTKKPECVRAQIQARYAAKQAKSGQIPLMVVTLLTEHLSLPLSQKPAVFDKAPLYTQKGGAHAPIQLVEFADFRCHHCKDTVPFVKQLEKTFADQIQITFKHFPLQNQEPSILAAEAAEAAGAQGQFFAYHELLFANQDMLSLARLNEFAQTLKLDMKKFTDAINQHTYRAQVLKDKAEGEHLNIQGTPAIFINGYEYKLPRDETSVKDFTDYIAAGLTGCQ